MSIRSKTVIVYTICFAFGIVAGVGMRCEFDALRSRQANAMSRHERYYRILEQNDLTEGAFTEWLYEVERELSKEEAGHLVELLRKKLQTMHLAYAGLTTSNQNDFMERLTRAMELLKPEARILDEHSEQE